MKLKKNLFFFIAIFPASLPTENGIHTMNHGGKRSLPSVKGILYK